MPQSQWYNAICQYAHFCSCVCYLCTCIYTRRDPTHRSHGNSAGGRPSSAGTSVGNSDSGSSSRKFSRPPGDEVYVRNYRLLKTIGKGNFAKVKLARHMPTGIEVSD